MKNWITLLALSIFLAACTSTSKPDASKAEATAQPKSDTAQTAAPDVAAQELAEQAKVAQELDKEVVHFDFDKSVIRPEFRAVMRKQADFLMANKNVGVTLEGNCDERGSTEYNLALGGRRANAVGSGLQALGVSKERIHTVSNGEEKPRMNCHEEKCWKENRRVDFVHKVN